jgi:transcriptional regulator with XRE-family HTH domain
MKFRDYRDSRLAADSAFRAEYEALAPEFDFIRTVIAARLAAGLTQYQLAKMIGTSQPAIARMEAGATLPSTRTLQKLAGALNLTIQVTPEKIEAHQLPEMQAVG